MNNTCFLVMFGNTSEYKGEDAALFPAIIIS